jgi:hypothetical protein
VQPQGPTAQAGPGVGCLGRCQGGVPVQGQALEGRGLEGVWCGSSGSLLPMRQPEVLGVGGVALGLGAPGALGRLLGMFRGGQQVLLQLPVGGHAQLSL